MTFLVKSKIRENGRETGVYMYKTTKKHALMLATSAISTRKLHFIGLLDAVCRGDPCVARKVTALEL
jgi:hypothetical protein